MQLISKISKVYVASAIVLVNTFVLFALVNVVGLLALKARRPAPGPKPADPAVSPFEAVYPNRTDREIRALLNETWSRRLEYEPFTQFRERPFSGRFIHVDENGFRRIKNQCSWPPSSADSNIFLFGGSTSFGYGVADEETTASYLQETLRPYVKNICVFNFGRGYYFSTQERILLERLLAEGFVPQMAVFVDGLNEFSHHDNQPYYADSFRDFIDQRLYRIALQESIGRLPIIRLIRSLQDDNSHKKTAGSWEESGVGGYWPEDETLVSRVVDRYLGNKKMIEAFAAAYGFRAIFVWQPVPSYKYDLRNHQLIGRGFTRHRYTRHGYLYAAGIARSNDLGRNFFWLADLQESLQEPLYIDNVHYSARMSRILAATITEQLLQRGFVAELEPSEAGLGPANAATPSLQ